MSLCLSVCISQCQGFVDNLTIVSILILLRFLGYANEVGEAFRALVHVR